MKAMTSWGFVLLTLAACQVDAIRFSERPLEDCQVPGDEDGNGTADCQDPRCADEAACRAACGREICDGLDNDCSGTVDDREAIGSAAACAAPSCAEIRDRNPAQDSGVWWIAPRGLPAMQVYCDQRTDGGGWALVWANHGGSKGGEESNQALLARATVGRGDLMVLPSTMALTSAIHQGLYNAYWAAPERQWIKLATLWDNAGALVNQQHIRVELGAVSMRAIFEAPIDRCFAAPSKIRVTVNGTVPFGSTNLINHYTDESFGLANSGNGNQDLCGQPADNLITDPVGNSLFRVDAGDSENAIRHLFGYVQSASGRDASRCLYDCWTVPAHYDAWVWAVR